MLIIKAIILGMIQSISEFLPISSSGHLAFFSNLFGVEIDLSFSIMLHIGTLLAVITYFYKDVKKCIYETGGIIKDTAYNISSHYKYTDSGPSPMYKKIISNNYRKISVMIIISVLATAVVSLLLFDFSDIFMDNLLCSGLGMFITAIVLFVASFADRNIKGPKEAKYLDAAVIGAFQGASIMPGVSRLGITNSVGRICGFTYKFNRLYSYMLIIPTVAGAMITDLIRNSNNLFSIGVLPCIFAVAASAVTGYFIIHKVVKLFSRNSLKGFSVYCLCFGIVSLVFYYA